MGSRRADSPRDLPFEPRSIGRAHRDVVGLIRTVFDDSETPDGAVATLAVDIEVELLSEATAARVLGRAGYGWSRASADEIASLGFDSWIASQLDPGSIEDPDADAWVARSASAGLSAAEILKAFRGPARELRALTLARATFSTRQLFERTVELWNDWFHVDQERGECRVLKTVEDRGAIRAHALGSFRELLGAVAKSGAMLEYLDNRSNSAAAPNENFARELLELHTLGTGEFDERDVREIARCFTGWAMVARTDPRFGEFEFRSELHDEGPKVVLGLALDAGGGVRDGERVLDMLASHPATARRVAERIAARFLGENASSDVVLAAASAFVRTGGDVRAVLRATLTRESFEAAEARGMRRYLRPFDLVVALLRATGARVDDFGGLVDELAGLGHAPFAWPSPDGYPDGRAHWEAAFAARCALCERFFEGAIPGVSLPTLPVESAASPEEFVVLLDQRLTGGRLSASERGVLTRRARDLWPMTTDHARRMWALAACSPGFWEV